MKDIFRAVYDILFLILSYLIAVGVVCLSIRLIEYLLL